MIVENPLTGVNGAAPEAAPGAAPDDPPPSPLALDPETMRTLGYRAVDALVARWSELEKAAPWAGADRASLDRELPVGDPAPEAPLGAEAVLDEALTRILPVAARVDHPLFMAYIPSAPTWPSVLADFLASGFNTFQGTWQGASAPSRIEMEVLEWFRGWLGMPEGSSGLFTSGGSAANALAVVAAREAAFRAHASSRDAPFRPSIYLSDQGHSSLLRAARVAGIPPEGIRVLATDEDLRLNPEAVREAVIADRAAGLVPVLLAANGGATSTGIVDPLASLADLCQELGLHFHVDAAYGGFAALVPEGARALRGIQQADSVTLDPHKWLFQPFECGCLMVRDPALLTRAFRVEAAYLEDTLRGEEEVNFGERGLQLTRSFRALKVWMSVRSFGLGAFRKAVEEGMALARRAEARIGGSAELELVTPAELGIVVWRARSGAGSGADPEDLHRRIQARLLETRAGFLSSTRIRGVHALRLCILNPAVRWEQVEAMVTLAESVVRAGSEGPE